LTGSAIDAITKAEEVPTATKLSTPRRIIFVGEVVGSATFDGTDALTFDVKVATTTGNATIVLQPTKFSFKRLYDATGDPGMPNLAQTGPTLITIANGADVTYQWQWRKVGGSWADATDTEGSGFATSTFIPEYAPGVANWGLYEYRCIVTGYNLTNAPSDIAQVAVGCGAKTASGWLRFACQNVGATPVPATGSLDNYSFSVENGIAGTDGSADAKGYLFQWGRAADGHQLRNSGLATALYTGAWNSNAVVGHGRFIPAPGTPFSWRTNGGVTGDVPYGSLTTNPPCGTGWQVPTSSHWTSIFNGTTTASQAFDVSNTYNAWVKKSTFDGYKIQPKLTGTASKVTTLFLPAAGNRLNTNGMLDSTGSNGFYWSSSASNTDAGYMTFSNTTVSPANTDGHRAQGFSLRCVAP
jgi:uncharacterized protein (TIGR02145 family)